MNIIQLEPYPPQLAVVFTKEQHDELREHLDLPEFGHWDGDVETRTATTFTFNRQNYPYRLMVVEIYMPDDLKFNTISHEGIHVMSSLMSYVGLTYDTENDEWYAYQHDFIVTAIMKAHDEYLNAKVKPAVAHIETGNHPAIAGAENYVKQLPVFSLDDLNSQNGPANTSFLDE